MTTVPVLKCRLVLKLGVGGVSFWYEYIKVEQSVLINGWSTRIQFSLYYYCLATEIHY